MKKEFIVLNGMFKYAVYPKHLLGENLMQYVKKRKVKKPVNLFDDEEEGEVVIIVHEEFCDIVSYLKEHPRNKYMALPVQIAYYTGLRAGEVCALTWDDIHLEKQYLNVRRSMYYDTDNKCWELKTPKNGKPRRVDFGDQLTAILREAKTEQLENRQQYDTLYQKQYCQSREMNGQWHTQIFTEISPEIRILGSRKTRGKFLEDADRSRPLRELQFVCSKPDGELLTTQTLKWCNKVVKKNVAGMEDFHFHMLRHTYASNMLNNGASFKDVQMLLGHADIQITLNTYAHVTVHSRKKAVDILERVTAEKKNG